MNTLLHPFQKLARRVMLINSFSWLFLDVPTGSLNGECFSVVDKNRVLLCVGQGHLGPESYVLDKNNSAHVGLESYVGVSAEDREFKKRISAELYLQMQASWVLRSQPLTDVSFSKVDISFWIFFLRQQFQMPHGYLQGCGLTKQYMQWT